MKRIVIFVLAAVLLIGAGFLLVEKKKGDLARLPTPQAPAPTVQVAPVSQGTLELTAHYLGT